MSEARANGELKTFAWDIKEADDSVRMRCVCADVHKTYTIALVVANGLVHTPVLDTCRYVRHLVKNNAHPCFEQINRRAHHDSLLSTTL